MKVADIHDRIYDQHIIVTYGTKDELDKWYLKNHIKNPWEVSRYAGAITAPIYYDKNGVEYQDFHIHFFTYGFTIIVHETNHLTHMILKAVGMKLSDETMEAYAYYQDWIAGVVRDKMEEWTKKPKRRRHVSRKRTP